MPDRPALDSFGHAYARLAFGLERHIPGFIDAWLGSEADRAALEPASAPPAPDLVAEAGALKAQAATLDTSPQRREYLLKQITAMETVARTLNGEQIPYREEVRLLFDVEPAAKPEAVFEDAIRDLDALAPGEGPVQERLAEWRAQYIVSPETARKLVGVILPELRERTRRLVVLPDDETIEISMVSNQPWSGYNWYLGQARSRVDLNTDLPMYGWRFFDGGTTAVLDTTDGHTLILTSNRVGNTSLEQLYSVGVDPERYKIVVAKGVVSPRPAYSRVAKEIVLVNTPGVTTSDLNFFTFHRRRHPLYPFEPETQYP